MTERPNIVLGVLLLAAGLFGALIGAGLFVLGGQGLEALAAMIIGVFSACIFFLAGLEKIPLSSVVLVALTTASAVAFARGTVGHLKARRLLRALPVEPIQTGALLDVARDAGATDLFVAPASRPVAFCLGLFRPRVVITAGLLARLDPEEQAAVVWHEAHHARQREPLKSLIARLAAQTFFWIPALRELLDRYLLVKELAADRLAAGRTSRRALAGALSQVAGQPTPAAAVGLAEFAAARIDRLFDPAAELPPLFRPSRLIVSLAAAASLLFLVTWPGKLQVAETIELWSMLTTMSLHGLPGMIAGLVLNATMFALVALGARRVTAER